MNSLKIKHLKKIHFFSNFLKYGNLTGVKTHRDRLGNSGEDILELRVQIFGFGKGKRLHKGFICCPVVVFHSSVCSAHESSKISCFCSRLPFRIFTLESHFFIFSSFFIFSLSYYALENSKFIPNRWIFYQDDFGWITETTALLVMKIFQGKTSSV